MPSGSTRGQASFVIDRDDLEVVRGDEQAGTGRVDDGVRTF
jgi:hypothetical protein